MHGWLNNNFRKGEGYEAEKEKRTFDLVKFQAVYTVVSDAAARIDLFLY